MVVGGAAAAAAPDPPPTTEPAVADPDGWQVAALPAGWTEADAPADLPVVGQALKVWKKDGATLVLGKTEGDTTDAYGDKDAFFDAVAGGLVKARPGAKLISVRRRKLEHKRPALDVWLSAGDRTIGARVLFLHGAIVTLVVDGAAKNQTLLELLTSTPKK
jgi:hypothetical protein